MAKVYDVPADVLIGKLAEILKNEDIPAPSWIPFVKTGAHADKPPQDREWWHTGVPHFEKNLPTWSNWSKRIKKRLWWWKTIWLWAAHHKDAGGAIIRNAIHGLEKLDMLKK